MFFKLAKIPYLLAVILALSVCPLAAQDQTQSPNQPQDRTPSTYPNQSQTDSQGQTQPEGSQDKMGGKHHRMHGKGMHVTGCLQKGSGPDEYTLTSDDGRKFTLHSTSVSLAEHVGHKVTVSGKMAGAGSEGASSTTTRGSASQGGQSSSSAQGAESGNIDVTHLKMVSATCP